MASFDIDLLKIFVTITDTGGFSCAARHLLAEHITHNLKDWSDAQKNNGSVMAFNYG